MNDTLALPTGRKAAPDAPPAQDPEESDLRVKLLLLESAVERNKARLRAQQERIERLRASLKSLRGAPPAPAHPAPRGFAAQAPAPLTPQQAPRGQRRLAVWQGARHRGNVFLIPRRRFSIAYAVAGAMALAMDLGAARPPLPPERPIAPLISAAAVPEEEASLRALDLVHEYMPDDAVAAVHEILAPEILRASESEAFPWVVTRASRDSYLVSFRPYADAAEWAPVYEFEVDLAAGSVRPSPETASALRAGTLALSR